MRDPIIVEGVCLATLQYSRGTLCEKVARVVWTAHQTTVFP